MNLSYLLKQSILQEPRDSNDFILLLLKFYIQDRKVEIDKIFQKFDIIR